MSGPRFEIVVVSFFGSGTLPELVASAVAQLETDWRMTVVDNSGDGEEGATLAAICSSDPRIRLLAAPGNLGYFGAAQFSLDYLEGDAEWVIVSNADIRLSADALVRLSALRSGNVGVVGPAIISSATGADQNPYMGTRPTRFSMWRRRLMFRSTLLARPLVLLASRRAKGRALPTDAGTEPRAVYAVHGAWMAFSAEYFRRGGDFAHQPFLFGEELTAAERCRDLELTVLYEPSVRVEHAEHQVTGTWRSTEVLRHQRAATRYSADLLFPPRRRWR
jgi:GT2 family glycosyltransferase